MTYDLCDLQLIDFTTFRHLRYVAASVLPSVSVWQFMSSLQAVLESLQENGDKHQTIWLKDGIFYYTVYHTDGNFDI